MDSPEAPHAPLTGKRVLITGGTTGIGRAVAIALAGLGTQGLIFGRDEADLNEALAAARASGGDVYGIAADVSRVDEVRRVFATVDERLGGLDILVNNAAVTGEAFQEDALETIEYVVRTNVVGYLACAHEAVSRMTRSGVGNIVLLGSMNALLREPEGSSYVATKAAIQGFAESLRKTVNEQGIKVTLIEPGKVATDLVDEPETEKQRRIDAGEMLMPEDVAEAVVFALRQPARCDVVALQLRPHRQVI